MKKGMILLSMGALLAAGTVFGYDYVSAENSTVINTMNEHGDKYCAKMRDGKLVVMHKGAELAADITLSSGVTIKRDGTVIKKNGSQVMLKEGECVDADGDIKNEKSREPYNKDK